MAAATSYWREERQRCSVSAAGKKQQQQQQQQRQQQRLREQTAKHPTSSAADKLGSLPPLLPESLQNDDQQTHLAAVTALSATPSRSSRQQHSRVSSSWRQSITNAANKLSCKTVMDLNSGLCTAELSWHVRTEHQPARMAVKLSNRQHTRVTFDAQVAVRRAGPMLRLAGSPQRIHAASILMQPARQPIAASAVMGSTGTPSDGAAQANTTATASAQPPNQDTPSNAGSLQPADLQEEAVTARQHTCTDPAHAHAPHGDAPHVQHDRGASQAADAGSSTGSSRPVTLQQGRPRQRQRRQASLAANDPRSARKQQQPVVNSANSSRHNSRAHAAGPQAAGQLGSAAPAAMAGAAAVTAPAQTMWELGWNWKVGGPVGSVTRQFDSSNNTGSSSSSSSGSSSGTVSPLAVQQLKAAYDAKSRSYTLTAGGGGWNVTVNVPTHTSGVGGLVPRVWTAGCRPKITLSLVPELTCF